MLNNELHPSDQELLLLADGELLPRSAVRVRSHLASCQTCLKRSEEIKRTIADFVRLHNDDSNPQLASAAGPRALLKARLAELAAEPQPQLWPLWLWSPLTSRVGAWICAVLLVVVAGIWGVHRHNMEVETERMSAGLESSPLPNRSLTPGATRPVTRSDVCTVQHGESAQGVPVTVQRKIFQEYGMPNAQPSDYELDYLITPELGGSDDPRNLWPEPHSSPVWNSYVKDALEDRLHQLVCNGSIDLATAQHDIATDWIAAYKKYFRTDRPSRIYSGLA